MNAYRIQQMLMCRLFGGGLIGGIEHKDITEADLTGLEHALATKTHRETGQPFGELAAEFLAANVRRLGGAYSSDMARLERIVPRYPGLARHLLKHFPDEIWLRQAASFQQGPRRARDQNDYVNEACMARDCAEDDWLAKKAKVDAGTANDTERVDELIAYAEVAAGTHTLGHIHDPVGAHLREERIEALASLMTLFARPDAVIAEPVEY
jgi:hypothetical protein